MSAGVDVASVVETERRPGWPEIAAAAVTYVVLLLVVPPLILTATSDAPVVRGLALAALSGALGFAAFFVAFAIRRLGWAAFGVHKTRWRWIFLAIGLGLVAIVVTRLIAFVVVGLTGDLLVDPQGSYRDAANGGPLALALQLLFIGVLTGMGEEFAFRGVLTRALTRYGAVVAVVASTVVFALAHGINLALIPATVVGLIAGILTVKTRSIWPAVVVHVVNNGVGTLLSLLVVPAG